MIKKLWAAVDEIDHLFADSGHSFDSDDRALMFNVLSKILGEELTTTKRKLRETRHFLTELVTATETHIKLVDQAMESSLKLSRSKVGTCISNLELAKDIAKRFGLGDGLKKTKKKK